MHLLGKSWRPEGQLHASRLQAHGGHMEGQGVKDHWVEVDPAQIELPGSAYLWVLDEQKLDSILFKRNGTLVYTVDTKRFFVYNKQQPVAVVKQPSILRRWLRRAGWFA